ncbi:actin-binding LIM protein 3 isoform X2 [Apus apus]|uniref:actin-binding LIM protein 3 isoform X2 n=1 Tax=Apus apus TaxID=8895 RepID=UPI0021F8584E|nr:actin-binding LIM protein 3 isoform X2 [Apus apus]
MEKVKQAVPYQQNPYTPGSSSTVIQCYRCGDTCKGEVVRVQSNHFHIRCFTCQVCGCDLAQSGFFFKNQEYICTHDYQQLYGTRCDSCGDFITGEVISALGRTYHPKCFVCSTCRKPFPIGDKVTFSGKDCVCQNCSHSLISTKPIKIHGPSHCAGCKEEIKQGQSLLALEKQWHVSCFKCQTCGIILTGEYISKDGVPYCESDYHAQFGIKCETCNRYISGRVLEAGGKHYHPTCARCVRCHQMFTEGEEMYLTGSEVWHPICKQAARAEKKLKHRRTSETSISPPGSSIGSPNRVICAKVDNEILNYKDLAALPKIKAIYEVQRPDLISYEPYHRYMSDETLERYSYGESLGTLSPYSQDIYESFDTRQRRASSPGYIDSPTYSRQGMSPTIPRSPHHFYRSAAGESNIYRKPPIYKRHATKSKTSEDIAQSSKYSPAYSPDPYYHSESEYWSFQGSPKAPRARRFSSGGEEDGYDRGMHKIQSGIGRLILREEMKARSNSYADPWTPPRSSASSREALHMAGYEGSLNGSPRTHYLADSDPLISKSASLPAYRRNGLHRPPSAELFHYDSTNAVNWGMREYKVRCSHSKEQLSARGATAPQRETQNVSMCPRALQKEALPSAHNVLPSSPSISTCQSYPGTVGLGPESSPSCQGPKLLAKQKRLLGKGQRSVVVLVVRYSHPSLGHSWFHRVSRLFQNHQGDSRWIRVTLRASHPSALPHPSPGGSCATQALLNTAGGGFALVASTT